MSLITPAAWGAGNREGLVKSGKQRVLMSMTLRMTALGQTRFLCDGPLAGHAVSED